MDNKDLTFKKLNCRELQVINILMHILMWVPCILIIALWSGIPDKIAQHYNLTGEIDIYGNKTTLIAVIAIAFPMYGMHFAAMYLIPYIIDAEQLYGKKLIYKVKGEDIRQGIILILKMTAHIFILIMLFLQYTLTCSIMSASIGAWSTPVFIGVLAINSIYYISKIISKNREIKNRAS